MAGELDAAARQLFSAYDSMDVERILAMTTEDAQSIDEMSRCWLRGRDELEAHLRKLVGAVSDLHTELRDVQEEATRDAGVLTCWMEQDYTMDGTRQHISAPTTMVLRREKGVWRLALFHSIPLSRESPPERRLR